MANVTFHVGVPNGQSGTYKLYHSANAYDSSTSGMTLLGTLTTTFQEFTVDDARYLYVAQDSNSSVIPIYQVGLGYRQAAIPIGSRIEADGNYVVNTGQISSISGATSNAWIRFLPDPGNPSGGGAASAIATSYEFKLTTDNANNEKAQAFGIYQSGSSTFVGASFSAVASASVDTKFPATTISGSSTYALYSVKIYNEDDAPGYVSQIPSNNDYVKVLPNIATASMASGTGTLDQTPPAQPGQVTLTFSSGTVSTTPASNFSRTHDYQPGYPSGSYQTLSALQLNTANGGIAFNLKSDGGVGNTGDFWASNVVNVEMGNPTDWRDVFTAFFNAINAKGSTGTGDFGTVSKTDPGSISGTGTITIDYASTAVAVGGSKHGMQGYSNDNKPILRENSGVKPFVNKVTGSFGRTAINSYAFSLIGSTLETSSETPLADSTFENVNASGSTIQAGGVSGSLAKATLEIPAGALSSNVQVGLNLTSEGNPRINGLLRHNMIKNPVKYSSVVSLTPHGQTFDSAVTIKFKLTGSYASSCPADLKIFKSRDDSGFWYELPSDKWSCSSGQITINTTEFSRYQAVGGILMSQFTRIDDSQLQKITTAAKLETQAIDITGSAVQSSIVPADRFIIQSVGGTAKSVSASVMQDFFSAVDVTASNSNESFQLVFHDGTPGAKLARDTDLTYNASTNALTVTSVLATSLSASGQLNVGQGANIDGALDVDSTLNVAGVATMAAVNAAAITATSLSSSGVLNVGQGANIDGAVDIDSTLNVAGAATMAAVGAASLSASGDLNIGGAANIDGAVDLDGALTVEGLANLKGSVDLGDATSDTITATGRFDSDLVPSTDSARALGTSALQWSAAHVDVGHIDQLGSALDANSQNITGVSHLGTTHLTASHAKITNLDVTNINSVTQTETTLEVVDKLIIAASGSASAAADGGGLQIGGHSAGDDVASFKYSHSGTKILGKIAGTEVVAIRPAQFDVVGGISGSGDLNVGGAANIDGALDVDSTLNVAGAATMAAVGAASLSASGDLNVGGAANIDGALDVDSTLNVAGAATMAAVGAASLSASGDLNVGGVANIDGALDVDSTLNVAGAATMAAVGAASLSASGDLNIGGAANIDGAVDMDSTLTVAGAFSGAAISGSGDLNIGGAANIDGALDVDSTLNVAGTATMAAVAASSLSASGDLNIGGNANIDGAVDLDGALTVEGLGKLNGDVDLGSATSDTITATGRFDSALVPSSDNTRDLGASSLQWKDLYINGQAHIDALGQALDANSQNITGVSHLGTTHLTASHAKITNLDVTNINSITQTETTLEVVDKLIVAASGSASAAADGGGLQIGGHSAGDDVASFKYSHSGTKLLGKIAGTEVVAIRPAQFDVVGGISGSGDLNVGGAANIDGALDVDSTLNVAGAATMAAVGAASLSASGDLNIGGAANIDGALDVDSTLNVAGAVTLSNASVTFSGLADLTNSSVAHGDKFVIQDADASGVAKEITLNHIAAFMAGSGLKSTNGVLSLDTISDVAMADSLNSILSANGLTASLSQEPLDAASVQVYRNGVLQLSSGSVSDYYDYQYDSSGGSNGQVKFRTAISGADIMQIRYIKKND